MQPLDPFRFLLISFAGWINQHQRHVIDYLQEENRILRDQLGNKRPRLTDDQRRRLALKANKLGRKVLAKLDTLFTPNTLVLRKYSVRAKNIEVIGERCAAQFNVHQAGISVRVGTQSTYGGRAGLQGTVDDFVAVQSTLEQSVSTCFNTNDRKRF